MSGFNSTGSFGFSGGGTTICCGGGGSVCCDLLIVCCDGGFNSTVRCASDNCASGGYSTAFGRCNTASGQYSTTSGGYINTASGCFGVVSGGVQNTASAYNSAVLGGHFNTACGCFSSVVGGDCNISSGYASFTGGGRNNTSSGFYSFTGGGSNNTSSGSYSFTGGGTNNLTNSVFAFTGGGANNITNGNASFTGGGLGNNTLCFASVTVGGYINTTSGSYSFTGSGYCNTTSGSYSFTGGGFCNTTSGCRSSILGGQLNNTCGFADSHIIGSCINATQVCTTFVNCLSAQNLTNGCGVCVGCNGVITNYAGPSLQNVTDIGNTTDNNIVLTYDSGGVDTNKLDFFDVSTSNTSYTIEKGGTGNVLSIKSLAPLSNFDMALNFDAPNNTIKTTYGTGSNVNGISLDIINSIYRFGRINNLTSANQGLYIDGNGRATIGSTTPDSNAVLSLVSTGRGFLPPSMTATQRGAISSPTNGLIVYQTDGTSGLYIYNNSVWQLLTSGVKFANYVVQSLSTANWSDSTTYYFGATATTNPTSQGISRGIFNKSGTITSVYLWIRSLAIPSTEAITIKLWKATGVGALSQIASTTFSFSGGGVSQVAFNWTGLSLSASANDTYEFSVEIPVMATNPTSVFITGNIELQYS